MHATPRFGLGFRTEHLEDLLGAPGPVSWLEILSDNHLRPVAARRAVLERLRCRFPLALHGVGLDLASDVGPRADYLAKLRALADGLDPAYVSDHLCWTGLAGIESHDLLPVAWTREVLALVAARVARVQDALGRRLLLENPTAYVAFRADEMGEADFFRELCARTGCGMLLDVNNLFVNARNLGVDPAGYLDALDPEHVGYLHVAGHAVLPDLSVDTHGAAVSDAVWDLYAEVARRFPRADVIVERDDAIPPFAELAREVEGARERWRGARDRAAPPRPAQPEARAPRVAAAAGSPRREAPAWRSLRAEFWSRLVGKPPGFDHATIAGLDALFDATRPVPAARGLRVYSDAYVEAARRALATHFPALARVLGEREFAALAADYLDAHPARSHDYVQFGASLPDFVRSLPWRHVGVAPDALADLAALEQAQLEVQEATDDGPRLGPDALAALGPEDWERVRFRFAGALRLLACRHDVLPASGAVARGERAPRPARRDVAYLVTRREGGPRTDALDPRAGEILAALAAGVPFADACRNESDVETGVRALALVCARGSLRGVRVTGPGPAVIEAAGPGGSPR
jgi:hypothetical protein